MYALLGLNELKIALFMIFKTVRSVGANPSRKLANTQVMWIYRGYYSQTNTLGVFISRKLLESKIHQLVKEVFVVSKNGFVSFLLVKFVLNI